MQSELSHRTLDPECLTSDAPKHAFSISFGHITFCQKIIGIHKPCLHLFENLVYMHKLCDSLFPI